MISGIGSGSLMQSIAQSAFEILSSSTSEEEEEKTTAEILAELKQNGTNGMTAQEIADEYGITVSEAEQILEKIEGSENEPKSESVLPDYSTFALYA